MILKDLLSNILEYIETLPPNRDEQYIFQGYKAGRITILLIMPFRNDIDVDDVLIEVGTIVADLVHLNIMNLKIHNNPNYCSFLFYDGKLKFTTKKKIERLIKSAVND